MGLLELLLLYLSFQLKHLFCDYIQPHWIAVSKGKALRGIGGKALLYHAGVHAIGTFIVTMIFDPSFWWLAIVDFFVHGIIDRVKSLYMDRKNWKMDTKKFWFAFGVDQEAHNLTHITYVILIFMAANPELTFL